jgi:hypothetical protein
MKLRQIIREIELAHSYARHPWVRSLTVKQMQREYDETLAKAKGNK